MKKLACILTAFFLLISFASSLPAEEKKKGKLDAVEESLEEPKWVPDSEAVTPRSAATQGAMSLMADFFVSGLAGTGGHASLGEMQKELRDMESPALPVIRIEPSYQYVFDGVHGFAGQVEMGYLFLGADVEYLYYWEKANSDNLNFVDGHFLLRTLFAQIIEADMALGAKAVIGDSSHTGFDMGFPFYIFFGKHFIWDVKPYITIMRGRDVYDLSSGLSYKYKMFGVRAAYRMISIGGETLHGPRIGAFFQW